MILTFYLPSQTPNPLNVCRSGTTRIKPCVLKPLSQVGVIEVEEGYGDLNLLYTVHSVPKRKIPQK